MRAPVCARRRTPRAGNIPRRPPLLGQDTPHGRARPSAPGRFRGGAWLICCETREETMSIAAESMPMAAPSAAADRRRRIIAIVGASSGNLVEWYDFYVYSFTALYFAGAFF